MTDLAFDVPSGVRDFNIHELTVREIMEWFAKQADASDTQYVFEAEWVTNKHQMTLADLSWMTSASDDDVLNLTPRELHALCDKCKEVNADFFAQRSALIALARKTPETALPSSEEPAST